MQSKHPGLVPIAPGYSGIWTAVAWSSSADIKGLFLEITFGRGGRARHPTCRLNDPMNARSLQPKVIGGQLIRLDGITFVRPRSRKGWKQYFHR